MASRLFGRGSWPEASRIAAILRQETLGGVLLLIATAPPSSPPTSATATRPARHRIRPRVSAPPPDTRRMGLRRPARDLLLRRRARAQARVRRRRPARPASGRSSGRRRTRRHGRAGTRLRRVQPRRVTAGLGHPDGDRHRLRPRRAGRDRQPPAQRAAYVPADPGRRRRPASRSSSSPSSTPRPCTSTTCCSHFCRWPRSRCWCNGASARGGCCSRSPATTWALVHASGVHATVAGVLLAFAVPVLRRDGGDGVGLAEHFEHRFRPLSAAVAVPDLRVLRRRRARRGMAGLHRRDDRADHPRHHRRTVRRQDRRRLRRHLADGDVHRSRARRRPRVARRPRCGDARAASGFTVSLLIGELAYGVGSTDRRARQDRSAGRIARLGHRRRDRCSRARNRRYREIDETRTPRPRRRRHPRPLQALTVWAQRTMGLVTKNYPHM